MAVTIHNTIAKAAGGDAQDDFDISVDLSWDTTLATVAIDTEESVMLKGVYSTETDADGYWEVAVVDNSVIEPAGSVYKITETERNSSTVINEYYVEVTTSATPSVWVGDILVATPDWEA